MNLNLELRTEVLRYSLLLEEGVNNLLLLNLGILDGGKASRLFGNRVGISFKNKIDLLYDIDIFSKHENSEMELLSVFRNKLLHDVAFSTLISVINGLDQGLKSKFKTYLEGKSIDSEKDCREALSKVFLKNIQTLKSKIQQLREINESKNQLLQENIENNIHQSDTFHGFLHELCIMVEACDLENKALSKFAADLLPVIQKYQTRFGEKKKKVYDYQTFKAIFGIRKLTEIQEKEMLANYEEYFNARKSSE